MSAPITIEHLRRHRDQIEQVAAAHHLANVRVFGSVARGTADEKKRRRPGG